MTAPPAARPAAARRRGRPPKTALPTECPVCDGLLGSLPPGQQAHALCLWATADDWAALRPFLTGTLDGVHAGGA